MQEVKTNFYELMHHSAHHHGKAVLMITHDPEEVKDYADRNIHLVRTKTRHGVVSTFMRMIRRWAMLSLLSYDFMQRAFLAVIAMSLFSPRIGDLPYLAPSEFDE